MRWPTEREHEFRTAFAGKRVAVTGGAGFIGGHLVEAMLELGASVIVVDDLSSGDGDFVGALVDQAPDRVRFVHASILDPRALDDALERVSAVFHLAASSSVGESLREPERVFDVNVRGTVEVCRSSQIAGAHRLVYASSAAVYGDSPAMPVSETSAPSPISPYGASKAGGEHVVTAWARAFNLPGVSLRFFNVFGPRQSPEGEEPAVIAAMSDRVLAGKPPLIFGDGKQTRDLIHVDNAVYAMLLGATGKGVGAGEAFNIAGGRETELLEVARLVSDAAGRPNVKPEFAPARPAEIRRSVADIALAKKALGYEPVVSLEEGVRETIAWRRNGNGREPDSDAGEEPAAPRLAQ